MLKVESLGIIGNIHDWIKDWLNNREQRVVLLGSSSKWIKVKSGVPQGSVLGPLLFFIFINDIDELINTRVLTFADDTKVYGVVASQEDIDKLQQDLKNLCHCSDEWLMLFNVDKCKIMHVGFNNKYVKYEINGKIWEEATEERDLGVIIQNDLKCSKQCT